MSWDDLDDTELLEELVRAYCRINAGLAASRDALAELEQLEREVLKRSDRVLGRPGPESARH